MKQIGEDKKNDPESIPVYKNITRYFSETAGMNIFLNTSCFSDVWPLYMSRNVVSPRLDPTKWFKWGALDGEIQSDGIGFNGFMYYGGMKATFLNVFKGQQPMASRIEGVIPSGVNAVTVLNLSDTRAYLTALETFRHKAGIIEHARKENRSSPGCSERKWRRVGGNCYRESLPKAYFPMIRKTRKKKAS